MTPAPTPGLTRQPGDFDANWCATCTGQRVIYHTTFEGLWGRTNCPTCHGTGTDTIPTETRVEHDLDTRTHRPKAA